MDGEMYGGGSAKGGPPACTAKYYPSQGGYDAGTIQGSAGGDPVGGMTTVAGNPGGNYEHQDSGPDIGGPPLGSTEGGPNHSQYGGSA